MSNRKKGTSLPPLDDSGSLAGRSPRQGKKITSYDYRPDSISPTSSPRSPGPNPRGGKGKPGDGSASPRNPRTQDVEKDFRTLCIGSPIPASDPHHDDMVIPETKQAKPKPFRKTPSITIDRVDEINLMKDSRNRGQGGKGGSGAPLSPVSYDLIDRMPTTPFAKGNKAADRRLLISPTTPPVERKGNRQVINYCRSDGHLASTCCSGDENEDDHRQRHNRSNTDGQLSQHDNRSGDLSAMHPKRRELSPSPRLTRRERENDGGWSPREHSPGGQGGQKRANRSRNISPAEAGKGHGDGYKSSPRDAHQSPSPRGERRRRDTEGDKQKSATSTKPDTRKPARLEPLGRKS